MNEVKLNRREVLAAITSAALVSSHPSSASAANVSTPGVISGDLLGDEAGRKVLSEGGNAVDAVAVSAMVASVTSLANCGPGGYGVVWQPGRTHANPVQHEILAALLESQCVSKRLRDRHQGKSRVRRPDAEPAPVDQRNGNGEIVRVGSLHSGSIHLSFSVGLQLRNHRLHVPLQ